MDMHDDSAYAWAKELCAESKDWMLRIDKCQRGLSLVDAPAIVVSELRRYGYIRVVGGSPILWRPSTVGDRLVKAIKDIAEKSRVAESRSP